MPGCCPFNAAAYAAGGDDGAGPLRYTTVVWLLDSTVQGTPYSRTARVSPRPRPREG
jgi:hypothetical protein